MGKFKPESPINLMIKTHGFPVKIFPTNQSSECYDPKEILVWALGSIQFFLSLSEAAGRGVLITARCQ